MVMRVQLSGFRELDKALAELPKTYSKGVLRRSATKALKPVLEDAKARVPVDDGDLRDSLKIGTRLTSSQRKRTTKAGGVVVHVGAASPQGAHAHLVEFGTAHSAAQPFLRPAWDANQPEVLRRYADELAKELDKTIKRLAKQAERGKLSRATTRAFTR